MNPFDLDTPLIKFKNDDDTISAWTIRRAVEGVQIFGGIGSGKTSGSGRMLALQYLSSNFGGLVLTVKPDEKKLWEKYCLNTGRIDDLIVIEPGGKYNFNFLEYESTVTKDNTAITDNIVDALKTVIRAGEVKDSGKSDDAFWETALDMLIFNVIDLCKIAYGSISVQKMYDIVQSLPRIDEDTSLAPRDKPDAPQLKKPATAFEEAYNIAKAKVIALGKEWYKKLSANEQSKIIDDDTYQTAVFDVIPEGRLLKFIHEFFFTSFKSLNSRTRSIIEFTFSGFMFRLLRDPVYSLFCHNQTNVRPEDCFEGKIILINLPVKIYHKVGRDCQILFKYIWQRTMEKRLVTDTSRPVFLISDEAQNFIHEHDADFQATARSSRVCTVYISQNLPNYYASMGGQTAEYKVKSFMGTLATKIFHANADIETNRYASELIGDAPFEDSSAGTSVGKDISSSRNTSLVFDRDVRPEAFISFRTGGRHNNYKVEGIIHCQGDPISNGLNYIGMNFDQLAMPPK